MTTAVIQSRLDNDFYAFTMGQLIHRSYRDVEVEFAFRNRTFSVALSNRIPASELHEQIEHVRSIRFTDDELDWLRGCAVFDESYLTWLREAHTLPPVDVGEAGGHLTLTYRGPWADVVFWETPLLAIVSELYYRRFATDTTEGVERLREKCTYLTNHPKLRCVEFGTRRRHSRGWQARVLEALLPLPNLAGTSNADLARTFGITASGTQAHQLSMVVAARNVARERRGEPTGASPLAHAFEEVATQWETLYGAHPALMTFLPDTYGTALGMTALADAERLGRFLAVRQDSGDPFDVGADIIDLWRRHGIDPHDRTIVFSDGLALRTMSMLWDRFHEETGVSFGWGTNLTNDLGFEPLSIVIKPDAVWIDGQREPCVKLSDNIAKATGTAAAIAQYKQLAGYHATYSEETRY